MAVRIPIEAVIGAWVNDRFCVTAQRHGAIGQGLSPSLIGTT
ncbi:MAG: hypothetical protein ABSE20_01565 [Acetobacteraceae bacterium]